MLMCYNDGVKEVSALENKTILLNTNREMPVIGLGVYKATGENEVERAICYATKAGYRLIDTASAYGNEDGYV